MQGASLDCGVYGSAGGKAYGHFGRKGKKDAFGRQAFERKEGCLRGAGHFERKGKKDAFGRQTFERKEGCLREARGILSGRKGKAVLTGGGNKI